MTDDEKAVYQNLADIAAPNQMIVTQSLMTKQLPMITTVAPGAWATEALFHLQLNLLRLRDTKTLRAKFRICQSPWSAKSLM